MEEATGITELPPETATTIRDQETPTTTIALTNATTKIMTIIKTIVPIPAGDMMEEITTPRGTGTVSRTEITFSAMENA